MNKTRLVTLLVTLALTLSMAAVVTTAQEETTPWDPVEVPEFQQDEAFAAYLLFEGEMEASGVPEEDMASRERWRLAVSQRKTWRQLPIGWQARPRTSRRRTSRSCW